MALYEADQPYVSPPSHVRSRKDSSFFLLNKVATKSKDHFPLCDGRVQIRDVGVTKRRKERIN